MTDFKHLRINLVKHDIGFNGLPAYIECHVGSIPKAKKPSLVLDLGNYIYRQFGLKYQMCPEFQGRGKKQTLRWFMTWKDIESIIPAIEKAIDPTMVRLRLPHTLPFKFQLIIIQKGEERG